MDENIKKELMELIEGWCKKNNRTIEEAFEMIKSAYPTRKN